MGPSYVLPWVPTPTSSSDGLWSVRWIKVLIPHIAFVTEFISNRKQNSTVSLFFYVKVLSENYPCITEEITDYVLWGIVNVLGGQTWTLTIDTASLKCSSKQVMCPNLFIGLAEFWCHFYVQLIPRLFKKKWLHSKPCYLQISQIAPHQCPLNLSVYIVPR